MVDVAREAGCSQTTVSFVLNNSSGIRLSQQTRDRVILAAKRLGYVFEKNGSSGQEMLTQTSTRKKIGFILDKISTSPEAAVAMEGACQSAVKSGMLVFFSEAGDDIDRERALVDAMIEQGVSALVFMTIFTREVHLLEHIQTYDIPIFLLNCYEMNQRCPAIVPSETAGGLRSTWHLIKNGHERIAIITGEIWMEAAQDRLTGYRRALASADIPFDPDLVIEGDWSASSGYDATLQLLALENPPTAIFCQNDRTAIGCYEALKETGITIPDDISVVGYDDEEISRHLHPPLTTSVLPHRDMGRWVIEQIKAEKPHDGLRYPVTKIECPLIERNSVASPRKRPD